MKKKVTLFLCTFCTSFAINNSLFSQESNKRINFVLLIDNDVPVPSKISKCYFSNKDTIGNIKDSIPFAYEVGGLLLSSDNYKKLITYPHQSNLYINFIYIDNNQFYKYQKRISAEWINELYLILKIHNYSLRESKKQYTRNGDGFGTQIIFPGGGAVFPMEK